MDRITEDEFLFFGEDIGAFLKQFYIDESVPRFVCWVDDGGFSSIVWSDDRHVVKFRFEEETRRFVDLKIITRYGDRGCRSDLTVRYLEVFSLVSREAEFPEWIKMILGADWGSLFKEIELGGYETNQEDEDNE